MKPEIKQRISQLNNGEVQKGYKKAVFGVFPSDWIMNKNLSQFVTLNNKKYNPLTSEDNPICIELEHINSDSGSLNGYTYGKKQNSLKNVFNAGDILFGKLRPYLAKYYFAKESGVCSTEIWVLNSKKNLCNKFLYCFVKNIY